jgi:hypothetical protein
MSQEDPKPKLHIDSDWKAEAQAEKERLAAEEKAKAEAGEAPGGPHQMPEASFKTLMSVLASQAIMGLGTMQDPDGKGIVVDLEGSKFSIDLLGVLEEKTEGNLTDEESAELKQILSELRARFVQISQLVAQQAAAGGMQTPGAPGGIGGAPPTSPLGG